MGETIKELRAKLWGGRNPFADVPKPPTVDRQGWGSSEHPCMADAIVQSRPRIIVEIGVWKGASALHMAEKLRELQWDAAVIAVDTWLGNWVHWAAPKWFGELELKSGYPSLYHKFAGNVVACGLEDYIVPLPLDSTNASELVRQRDIAIDMLHLDAGHTYEAVTTDLVRWWPSLRRGGLFIGDDYQDWPDTRRAIDDFLARTPHSHFQVVTNKCGALKT